MPLLQEECKLFALPTRLGGLGLTNPTALTDEYPNFQHLSALLTALVIQQIEDLGDA